MLRTALCGTALLAVCVTSGCGGGGHPSKRPIDARGAFAAKPSLVNTENTAGSVNSYRPGGRIIADDGFRPTLNGFAFENYGNDAGPINMTPANVEHLFGPQVCAAGNGNSCVLIPSARQWMRQENDAMANGHCMGFSVTALRFFTGNLSPSTFGAKSTPTLPIRGNDPLQSQIAEDFAYQDLPAVRSHAIVGTPSQVLRSLVNGLNLNKETYTLAIFKSDGSGGHALTPFAVEDRGHGQMAILVYDNNFPGAVRAVDVNTHSDTWHYVGGINPADTSEIYEGDARTKSMFLFPTTPGETVQPCPFCSPQGKTNPNPGVVGPSRNRYIEVALAGASAEHPHLLFIDPKTGQKTGFDNGQLVQQIPDILVNPRFAVKDWQASAEPTYDIQFGHPVYEVVVDGTNLKRPVTEKITINGAGVLFVVADIHIAPGQKDTMLLPNDDLGVTYASGAHQAVSPLIAAEFPTYDHGRARFNVLETALLGYKPLSPFTLRLIPKRNEAMTGSPGNATPLTPAASHLLWLDSYPVNGGTPEHAYRTIGLRFDPNSQLAQFSYLNPHGPTLPVKIIDGASGRLLGTEQVPPTKNHLGG